MVHSLMYNLLLVGALISKYININLPSLFSFSENPIYIQVSQIAFILLVGAMAYSQFLVWKCFSGNSISMKLKKRIIIFVFIIFIAIIFGAAALYLGYQSADIFLESIGDLLFITEIVILILIFLKSGKSKDNRESKLMRSYSLVYFSRYPLIILMLFIPEAIRFYSAISVLFYFNVIPLIWVLFFFRKGNLTEKNSDLNRNEIVGLLKEYKITVRESEIISLIMAGKSNREIEQILFISSHTVKNHIYNIYKKMLVNNRYELISLLTNFRD